MKLRSFALVAATASFALLGCGGSKGPPRHPVQEMTARASAKINLIDLVVTDPQRAERLRRVYVELAAIGREFNMMRARSLAKARADWQRRVQQTPDEAAKPETLELVLAPPVEDSKVIYERYVALMLEARSLLTREEFEKLDEVR